MERSPPLMPTIPRLPSGLQRAKNPKVSKTLLNHYRHNPFDLYKVVLTNMVLSIPHNHLESSGGQISSFSFCKKVTKI